MLCAPLAARRRFKNQWPHTKVADDVLIIRNDDDAKCAAATA